MRHDFGWPLGSIGLVVGLLALGLTVPAAAQDDPCWYEFCEYHRLKEADPLAEKLLPAYANADMLVVVRPSLVPLDPIALVTYPMRHLSPGGDPPYLDLYPFDPWWDQPRPAQPGDWNFAASGVLVGQRKVLTAKHVLRAILDSPFGYECSDIGFVFDFRKESDKIANEDIPTVFAQDQVFWCSEIAFGDVDWAVVKLDRPVPMARTPIKVRRFGEPQVGEEVALIGHPERAPLKGALGLVTAVSTLSVTAMEVPAAKGSSGSMLLNRFTGRVEGPAVTGAARIRRVPFSFPPSYQFCYDDGCGTPPYTTACVNARRIDPALLNVQVSGHINDVVLPRIGLQVHPEHDLDEIYGPPGGPFPGFDPDNTREYDLSVPSTDFRTVRYSLKDWRPVGAPPILAPSLDPGESTSFVLDLENPPPGMAVDIYTPGSYFLDQVFSDITFRSFEPRRQTLHVGTKGFSVTRLEPEAGADLAKAGVVDLVLENRWLVPQEVTVEVVQDGAEAGLLVDGEARKNIIVLGPVGDPFRPSSHAVRVSTESDGMKQAVEASTGATVRFTSTWGGEILQVVERSIMPSVPATMKSGSRGGQGADER